MHQRGRHGAHGLVDTPVKLFGRNRKGLLKLGHTQAALALDRVENRRFGQGHRIVRMGLDENGRRGLGLVQTPKSPQQTGLQRQKRLVARMGLQKHIHAIDGGRELLALDHLVELVEFVD